MSYLLRTTGLEQLKRELKRFLNWWNKSKSITFDLCGQIIKAEGQRRTKWTGVEHLGQEKRGLAEWSSCVDVEDVGAEVGRSSQLCLCASKKAALGTFLGQAQEWRLKHFSVWQGRGGVSLLSQTITSHISHMVSLQTVLIHAKVLGHTIVTWNTTKSVPCWSTIILKSISIHTKSTYKANQQSYREVVEWQGNRMSDLHTYCCLSQ